ncbi:MAG: hypothetical protein V1874_13570 [Spirochaetota bacterium]
MDINTLELSINNLLKDSAEGLWFNRKKEKLYDYISVGRQSSRHPVFDKISEVHKDNLHPSDFFNIDRELGLTVLSFAFNFNRAIVKTNAKENLHPSYEWYEIRHKFESIYPVIASFIKDMYHPAEIVVPFKSSAYSTYSTNGILVSNWSERHVAFACGLGSFGLHSAIITDHGCTHRLLSIIVKEECPETEIDMDDLHYNCLYYKNRSCGKCITRCPVGAIQNGVHDLKKCYSHEHITNKQKSIEIYGSDISSCALCMCGVPCDTQKPLKEDRSESYSQHLIL